MLQRFATFHMGRYRQNVAANAPAVVADTKEKKVKKAKKTAEDEINELPEVDQNTKSLRNRSVAAKAK